MESGGGGATDGAGGGERGDGERVAGVAVASDGAVTISWESPENKEPAIIFESTDLDGAGSTLDFGNDVLVSRVNVGYNHVIPAQSQRSIDTEPVMAPYSTRAGGSSMGGCTWRIRMRWIRGT